MLWLTDALSSALEAFCWVTCSKLRQGGGDVIDATRLFLTACI